MGVPPPIVLPSFEVVLEPEKRFLYIDQKEDFRVSITARWDGDPKPAQFRGQDPSWVMGSPWGDKVPKDGPKVTGLR